MKKKGFLAVILAVLTAGAASAQLTISGSFALGYMDAKLSGDVGTVSGGGMGYGFNIFADYLLPISVPLSLGVETGFDGALSRFESQGVYGASMSVIPILLRAAYHFDVHPKLDLYLVGKLGIALGSWSTGGSYVEVDPNFAVGMGFGLDAGVAYYFVPYFGLFAEAGFDGYIFSKRNIKADQESFNNGQYSSSTSSGKLDSPFYRFLTVGISTKF